MTDREYPSLQPNPGGVVDPSELVGRDRELEDLLLATAQGGAYVVGDRRMGKTSLLRKLRVTLEEAGHLVVVVSAETSDLQSFSSDLTRAVREHARLKRFWKDWTKEFDGQVRLEVAGQGIRLTGRLAKPGAATPETDLFALCARAAEEAGAASLVLVIDEIAVLAQHLSDQGSGEGEEFLRTLRRLRQQDGQRVRVVLAGSVGLHHAVTHTEALNDVNLIPVGPLTDRDAVELAQRLLVGTVGRPDTAFAEALAQACGAIPYYLHQVVATLAAKQSDFTHVDVVREVRRAVDDNLWRTDHYFTRLRRYFPDHVAESVELLDVLAHEGPSSLDDLAGRLANRFFESPPSRSDVADLLDKLRKDHYLTYDDAGYSWSSDFLRGVWLRLRERLGP